MITGSAAPARPSFLLFYFRLRAFSIQRARQSRSQEQAILMVASGRNRAWRKLEIPERP